MGKQILVIIGFGSSFFLLVLFYLAKFKSILINPKDNTKELSKKTIEKCGNLYLIEGLVLLLYSVVIYININLENYLTPLMILSLLWSGNSILRIIKKG